MQIQNSIQNISIFLNKVKYGVHVELAYKKKGKDACKEIFWYMH